MQLIIGGATHQSFLLHGSAFDWNSQQRLQKARALACVAEKALGVAEGQLSYLYERYEKIGASCD